MHKKKITPEYLTQEINASQYNMNTLNNYTSWYTIVFKHGRFNDC